MFDKYKARLKKFEEDHESVHKVIQHVEKNKTAYAAIGGSALTFAGVKAFGRTPELKQILKSNPSISGLAYKSSQVINNTIVQEMVRQGEPGKKTFWVEKGVWFPSRNAAAQAASISITSVSKCADGLIESVKGQHFVDGGNMI